MIFDLTMVRILDNTQDKKVHNAIKELIKDSKLSSYLITGFCNYPKNLA